MSDDLSMKALEGAMQRRAELVIAAGSDLALHCNGCLPEMEAVASGVPKLEGKVRERCEAAARLIGRCDPFDEDEAVAACAAVLAC
jgi:beta-N-acetylhexosaminidase